MILQLKRISVEKDGSRILNDVSMNIPEGAFYVLMGPTGCGKTTTLRVAGLLDTPCEGEVYFAGKKAVLNGRKALETRRRMATVFQHPLMFTGSVRDNIEWGLRIRGISRGAVAEKVTRAARMTEIEDLLDRNASTLSGGEARRTALARALALEPELLLLDEPTTSLHPSFRREFLMRLKGLHRETGTAFLMATHDFTDALAAGTCGAVMNEGNVVQQGTVSELLFNPGSRFMADFACTGNILPAELSDGRARIGDLTVRHTSAEEGSRYIAIPPEVIALSNEIRSGSERNRFPATVVSLQKEGLIWTVRVEAQGVGLDVAVTTGALEELNVRNGSLVYISFKASAVQVF